MFELHDIEARFHAILHELEVKLQSLFGSHPKIAEHVSDAKTQVTDAISDLAASKSE